MRVRVTTPMDPEDPTSEPASAESWTVRDRRGKPVSAASTPLFQPGAVLADRYELRSVLGRGGMGVVFEGYDRVLGAAVAVKIVRSEYAGDRAWAERLAREVKLARQINHPNVCRVFDFGQAEAHPFLTMELAPGGTLRGEIADGRHDARSLEQRLSDARMIVSGLAAIHAAGIIHRDLTLQNVLRMSDGSLVLSDFGLATDNFEGSTSVQGGTVAYMAPEVVRGGHASVASDLWSLAVVIHEVMFGTRPRWSANGREMLRPELGRALNDAERKVFDVCRACAAASPDERPGSASRVADALIGGVALAARRGHARALYGVLLLALLGVSAALARNFIRARRGANGDGQQARVLRPSGIAQDWTDRTKVLATVPDKIRCMTLLPDRRTIRFVWGKPRRAEDLDTLTGRRVPSPLVPPAYAEGCPGVARDGSKIVFAGHDRDLRPAAFVSTHLDGSDAVPVVVTGEQSLATDMAWLPDNQSFLYPVDINHSAIFSMTGRTSLVVPADTHLGFTTGYQVVGDAIIVTTFFEDQTTSVHRLRFPHLDEDLRFRIAGGVLDAATDDARRYYLVSIMEDQEKNLLVFDSGTQTAPGSAFIAGSRVRYPLLTVSGLAFVAVWHRPILVITSRTGEVRRFDPPPDVATASPCGDTLVAISGLGRDLGVVRLDWSGQFVERLGLGVSPSAASCSHDGRVIYYQEWGGQKTLMRCEGSACKPIYRGWLQSFALSPDDDRIVALQVGDDGLTVRWLRADGKDAGHDIVRTDVPCWPGWSSEENVWVAMHHGPDVVWREFVADTGKPTGVTAPGSWDCMDGVDDPQSPVRQSAKVVAMRRAEIRLMPSSDLRRASTYSSQ